jgi:hypothetical protein
MMAGALGQRFPIAEAVVHEKRVPRTRDEHVAVAVAPLMEARQELTESPGGAVLFREVDRACPDPGRWAQDCFEPLDEQIERGGRVADDLAMTGAHQVGHQCP